MNRGIYSAAMGMSASQRALDVVANNLANVSTGGYKGDCVEFGDALTRELFASGGSGPRIGSLGSGPREISEYCDFSAGPIRPTGNPLDLALSDPNAMFGIITPGGTEYTRDGSFTVVDGGILATKGGAAVAGEDGRPIRIDPAKTLRIDPDGRIRQEERVVGRIATYTGRFTKSGEGLWKGASVQPTESKLQVGSLEGSNVNAVTAMVQMIGIQRAFDMNQRAITTHDESTGRLLTLLNGR